MFTNKAGTSGGAGRIILVAVLAVLAVFFIFGATSLFEIVDADEVVVIQTLSGDLKPYIEPGPVPQWFGTVTSFPKLAIYNFEAPIVFNDAGGAVLHGSIQWEMPRDVENINELKTKYGSAEAIQSLINTVVDKCVYMTGPLMSSAESYATKKTDLIRFIEDQITRGVYKTYTKEEKIDDPITGQKKSVKVTEIAEKDGSPLRQEEPVLASLGSPTSNLAISEIIYSDAVNNQIAEQQKITMAVQTAIAEARKSEQNYITITKRGEANAAEAKWKQEVVKSQAVTLAQQKLEVAELDAKTASQEKAAILLRAEAESERRRKIFQADNALEARLKAYVQTQELWAGAFKDFKGNLVPNVQMSGSGGGAGGTNAAQAFMELLTAKAAKDLSVDVGGK